jgi:glycosyltransferase involved in cell wall biosynthesis
MTPKPSAVILVSGGFRRRTGYQVRCLRDKAAMEHLGFSCEIISIGSLWRQVGDLGRTNVSSPLSRLQGAELVILENYGALTAYGLLRSLGLAGSGKPVFVAHGSLDELDLYRFTRLKRALYSRAESSLVSQMTAVLCVSDIMANEFRARFPGTADRIHVSPNTPPNEFYGAIRAARLRPRTDLREALGLPTDAPIMLYSGNLQPWQHLEGLISMAKAWIRSAVDTHVVCVSFSAEDLARRLTEGGIPRDRLTVRSVPNHEVPDYLVAADWLWVVREETRINRVACPTKAVEYLISGGRLLISEDLGDLSDIVRRLGLGIVVSAREAEDPSRLARRILESTDDPAVSGLAPTDDPWERLPTQFAPGHTRQVFASALNRGAPE